MAQCETTLLYDHVVFRAMESVDVSASCKVDIKACQEKRGVLVLSRGGI